MEENIAVFVLNHSMILASTIMTFFRNECNGEDAPFTRKLSIYRVFGRKVKGDGQNDISVERTNAPLVNSQKA